MCIASRKFYRLWDVLCSKGDFFTTFSRELANVRNLARARSIAPVGKDEVETIRDCTKSMLDSFKPSFDKLHLRSTVAGMERIVRHVENEQFDMKRFHDLLADVEARIEDELKHITIFLIDKHAEKTGAEPLFGLAVQEAFPSSSYDVQEAGRCLAFDRSTAAVLHLMRALEPPLKAMASALDVKSDQENWGRLLNNIEANVRSRDLPPDFWQTRDRDFFTKATTQFFLIKNAWRNHVTHGRDKYTMEEAEEVFASVGAFMRHLSQELSEA